MARSEIRRKDAARAATPGVWAVLVATLRAVVRWFGRLLGRSGGEPARIGPYTLEEKIGEGGMGVVYRARHELLDRPAAIKLLAPGREREEDVKRFEREVRITSLLTHPNTIAVYDFGRTKEGAFYYAMEYVEGLDLQALVEAEGPQSPARVAHLLAQLAGALDEAHSAGLVHRDVKPANLMVCARGRANDVLKVLDFGLVKSESSSDIDQDEARRVIGTPLYLSPESITAPESLDARSDLYALGAVGYFLLTGVPPFSGTSLIDVCVRHLHEPPRPPSERRAGIPRALEALILACLAKSPDRRPESAAAVRLALLDLAAEWSGEPAAANPAVQSAGMTRSGTRLRSAAA
ncbi:MAG TPA: serine/threonine-protein kinase [Polyangiaceae bacterium]